MSQLALAQITYKWYSKPPDIPTLLSVLPSNITVPYCSYQEHYMRNALFCATMQLVEIPYRFWDNLSVPKRRCYHYSLRNNPAERNSHLLHFFFLQRYSPFSLALASLIIDAHSSLFNAFILHPFTPSSLKSSSTSFIHLSLDRPLPLLPSNFPSRSSLQTQSRSF